MIGRITTRTEVIALDGSVVGHFSTSSRYIRASNGTTLVQNLGRSGSPSNGILLDYGATKKSFTLHYHTNQAIDRHQSLDLSEANNARIQVQKGSIGREQINGFDCFIVPVYELGPNRTRVLIGKAWRAPDLNNLVVKEDVTRTLSGGTKRHVVKQLNVVSQAEPDPSLFRTDRQSLRVQAAAK